MSRGSGSTAGGGPLYSFTSHSGGTLQRLIRAASSQPARKGGQEVQGGGSGPTASGSPLYSFTSHSRGTLQRLMRAASNHPARRCGQEASQEVQGSRRSQQVSLQSSKQWSI